MLRVEFTAFGPPEQVSDVADRPDLSPPAADEVIIEIEAFPINPADLLQIEGRYAVKPPLPATLGAESVGRLIAVGSDVDGLQVGDRVINMDRENWAQQRKVKAARAIKVPAGVDPLQLAMLKVNPATALLMLDAYVGLSAGDWVIQNAANSAVGEHVIRLAAARGVKTLNVIRRPEPAAHLKDIGATDVLVDGDDLARRVQDITGDNGPKLAIDAVGGSATERLGESCAENATVLNYGLLSGDACRMTSSSLVFRDQSLRGFWLMKHLMNMAPDAINAMYQDLANKIGDGTLSAPVAGVYPLSEIKTALAHAGRDGKDGKVLVTPNGPVA